MSESNSKTPEIRLISTEDDQRAALEIRRIVFQIGQNVDPVYDYDGEDYKQNCYGFLALLNNIPVGTCRLRKVSTYYLKLERVAVLSEYRGKFGVGSALLKFVSEYVATNFPGYLIKSVAQLDAVPFYSKLGYVPVDETVIYEQNIGHYLMFYPPRTKLELDNLEIWKFDIGNQKPDIDRERLIKTLKKIEFNVS